MIWKMRISQVLWFQYHQNRNPHYYYYLYSLVEGFIVAQEITFLRQPQDS